jgi:hypothetical protein
MKIPGWQLLQTGPRGGRPAKNGGDVPLFLRTQPYQIKGSNEGPGGRPTPPLPQPAPPPPKSIEQAMKEPYTIRGDSSGGRSRGAIADMNTGAQITANLMRD